jgi:hypothetical protein
VVAPFGERGPFEVTVETDMAVSAMRQKQALAHIRDPDIRPGESTRDRPVLNAGRAA